MTMQQKTINLTSICTEVEVTNLAEKGGSHGYKDIFEK
jgi:hypothetical protein